MQSLASFLIGFFVTEAGRSRKNSQMVLSRASERSLIHA